MRYKEFNRNNVLEKCLKLFWQSGFRACAISDIVEETRVNRFSLYEEFGNKEGILKATLNLYKERYSFENILKLDNDGSIKEVLKKFYLSFFGRENLNDGCFVIHVGTELADTDIEVKSFLKNYLDELESRIIALLNNEEKYQNQSEFMSRSLIGLFCTSMSFCLIQSEKYRENHIENGINIILNKKLHHA